MENITLRIRLVSFKDSAKQNFDNTLYYIKKLIQLPANNDGTIILEPTDLASAFVLSVNETFDWHINEGNYCQIIFLTSKSKPKAIADVILWFNHLLDLIKDRRYKKEIQPELLCSITLQREYHFQFNIQQIENSMAVVPYSSTLRKNQRFDKVSTRQSIRGHLMKLKQFNHPVHCAICHGFIWGLHYQGFECVQCSLVTHRKCHQTIPFWCQKSLYPEPVPLNEIARLKFHIPHVFKQYEAPFVRAIVSRNHGHCYHCGSQIFRNALKCTQCNFIIHEHCQPNVPPMCTISYNSIAEIISSEDIFGIMTRNHKPTPAIEMDKCSNSSSSDLSWLGPLPEFDLEKCGLLSLPTSKDFEYIGRLGDGASAQVYCVEHIPSKQYVAIKVADGTNEQARQQLEVERQILFRYSHGNPYMIKAYCTFHQGSKLFFVMELVEGGTLYHKIQTTRMNEDEIRFYLAEIICVLQYLHSKKIIYRDLKLEHAIVCTGGHIRLVDYGLGRLLKTPDEICHTFCGTYTYMAPEVRCLEKGTSEKGYNYAVDFWGLGIMFVQMLYGEQLDFHSQMFSNNNEETIEPKNIAENLELPRHISSEARSCVIALLENNPEKRLGSPNSPHGLIRDHPFFKAGRRIDWQAIDEGLFKSFDRHPTAGPVLSDVSIREPLSTLILDRGNHGKSDWIAAGRSTCTSAEDEQFKSFDYINQSSWIELIQSDVR